MGFSVLLSFGQQTGAIVGLGCFFPVSQGSLSFTVRWLVLKTGASYTLSVVVAVPDKRANSALAPPSRPSSEIPV